LAKSACSLSINPDAPDRVDEIVFRMDYEDGGGINREIEMARAKFIVEAVNNYYRRQPDRS
jgi:hypothetical protein